jgi:hypothetical protein
VVYVRQWTCTVKGAHGNLRYLIIIAVIPLDSYPCLVKHVIDFPIIDFVFSDGRKRRGEGSLKQRRADFTGKLIVLVEKCVPASQLDWNRRRKPRACQALDELE